MSQKRAVSFISLWIIFQKFLMCKPNLCRENFNYRNETGKCYMIINELYPYVTAQRICNQSLSVIRDINDLMILQRTLIESGNNEAIWLNAYFNEQDKEWKWRNSEQSVNKSIFQDANLNQINSCAFLKFNYVYVKNGPYALSSSIQNENCVNLHSAVCEIQTDSCTTDTIRGFDSSIMEINPNIPYIENTVQVQCKDGFYSESDFEYWVTCSQMEVKPAWITLSKRIIHCKMVGCVKPEEQFSNANRDINYVDKQIYNYGDEILFKCNRGYVEYKYKNQTIARLKCKQSKTNKKEGLWEPQSFIPCVAIKCNMTELEIIKPPNAIFSGARNRVTQEEFNAEFQMNQFPYFNNVVDIQCNSDLFFSDRKTIKNFICDLKNQSEIEGNWMGYAGTEISNPLRCEAVTCMYEDVRPQNFQNLEELFEVKNSGNQIINVTNHEWMSYNYTNILRFFCKDGFLTGNQETFQFLKCGSDGNWTPRLSNCIKKTEQVDSGNKKFYIPPPQNANGAKEVGAIVIIIMVIFFSIIVILDLSTITRDIKILRKNIQFLRNYNKTEKSFDVEKTETSKKGN